MPNSQRFENFLPYNQHAVDENEINEVVDTLRSAWLTKGPKTLDFEQNLAAYLGSKYTVAVNSCTAALHLCLRIHNIQPGDEIITTPLTFCATSEVIEYFNAKPVFVDIERGSFNIDPQCIEKAITPKTKMIMPVHYGGIPCRMDEINAIGKKYNLPIVEDAAHSIGTIYKNKKIGNSQNLTAFSFYPTKNITTSEGGAITTDDEEINNKLRILSLHGISKDAWKRYSSEGQWYYEINELGYKYNFTDIQAALGLQQLKKLDHYNQVREDYAGLYLNEIDPIEGVDVPEWYKLYFDELKTQGYKSAWHLFVIMVDENVLNINRDQFIIELNKRNVGTSVHFIPLHLQPYYAKKYGYSSGDFEITEKIFSKIISIPLYPKLTASDILKVSAIIRDIAGKHKR